MIDPALFVAYPDIAVGDRVRYSVLRLGERTGGVGTVALIWIGIEEMCNIEDDDGTRVSVCRGLGDVVEKVQDGGPS